MLIKLLSFVSIGLSGLAIVAVLFGWLMFVMFLDSPGINIPLALLGSIAVALLVVALPAYVIKTLIWTPTNITEHFKNIIIFLGLVYPFIGAGIIALLIFLEK